MLLLDERTWDRKSLYPVIGVPVLRNKSIIIYHYRISKTCYIKKIAGLMGNLDNHRGFCLDDAGDPGVHGVGAIPYGEVILGNGIHRGEVRGTGRVKGKIDHSPIPYCICSFSVYSNLC